LSFFFSSRSRHTRCYRDWSSDVCSSDLDAIHLRQSIIQRKQVWFDIVDGFQRLEAIRDQERLIGSLLLNSLNEQLTNINIVLNEIGRASCRETVQISLWGVSYNQQKQ